jgi:tetratricopeptide (TPR) repeat protein
VATASEILIQAKKRHQAGDLAGAVALYKQAIEAEPGNALEVAHLALAFHQMGDLPQAEKYYRQTLALMPNNADSHFRLGLVLVNQKRLAEAAEQFREAARLRPDSAEAWNNLGNVSFVQGKWEEAITGYREAVRLRPDYAEAHFNLGKAYRENDQVEPGLACYREAVRLKPTFAKAHNNLGAALLEMGQVKEAEVHFRECLRHDPGLPQVLCTLAANGLYKDTDPQPDQLEARLRDGRLSQEDAGIAHFTLGLLLDRAGNYDQAFAHFLEGNRIRREEFRRQGIVFDTAEHARLIDRLMAVFTPEYFTRTRGLGLSTEMPVFIVGMPRSGSSLVEQILTHHPDVAGVGELRDFPQLVAGLASRLGTEDKYPECALRLDQQSTHETGEAYLGRLVKLVGTHRRITDKMLENFLHLGMIAVVFPHARIIHCRRDPMDVCVSSFLQIFRGMSFACDLTDLGEYYKQYERLMRYWQTVLPLPILEVVYEDLVADPEAGSRRLVDFCGLEWNERCLNFHENRRAVRTVSKLQVRQPVYRSALGRWQRFDRQLEPLRKALGIV